MSVSGTLQTFSAQDHHPPDQDGTVSHTRYRGTRPERIAVKPGCVLRSVALGGFLAIAAAMPARAQQPQIPTLQVCNTTQAEGRAVVTIPSRGSFQIELRLFCRPGAYPAGALRLRLSMNDSQITGPVDATSFDQLTSTGKATPTLYVNGRCRAEKVSGCRYWLFVADNGKIPRNTDIVGFLIMNGNGQRIAYGTGAIRDGDLSVAPTPN